MRISGQGGSFFVSISMRFREENEIGVFYAHIILSSVGGHAGRIYAEIRFRGPVFPSSVFLILRISVRKERKIKIEESKNRNFGFRVREGRFLLAFLCVFERENENRGIGKCQT